MMNDYISYITPSVNIWLFQYETRDEKVPVHQLNSKYNVIYYICVHMYLFSFFAALRTNF